MRPLETSSFLAPWHHYIHEFREAIVRDDRAAFDRALAEATGGSNVIRRNGMLIDGNEHGRSYNAMGQSDLGYYLLRAAETWDSKAYFVDGLAALKVLVTNYDDGGLRLPDEATGTAWYSGQTTRSEDDKGGTINKHLYATRMLFDSSEILARLGRDGLAARAEEAAEAGYLKMVKGDDGPLLSDAFVKTPSGDPYLMSWVYYGFNHADGERGYFLKDMARNAKYHSYDMQLIYQLGQRVDDEFDWRPFYRETMGGMTSFGGMLQVYLNKLAAGGLDVDTAVPYGQFSHNSDGVLPDRVLDWFESFLTGPRIEGTEADDELRGENLDERLLGRAGADMIRGGAGHDVIRGGGGADTLVGGSGDDVIVGGGGRDILVGGPGADVFRFETAGQSSDRRPDVIGDFGAEDAIDLRKIDANTSLGGDQTFHFIGSAQFSGEAGELRFENGQVLGDIDEDGQADLIIILHKIEELTEEHFLL